MIPEHWLEGRSLKRTDRFVVSLPQPSAERHSPSSTDQVQQLPVHCRRFHLVGARAAPTDDLQARDSGLDEFR